MTRKHFEAIANTIKNIPFTDPQDRVIAACRLADDVCAPNNSNFRRDQFLKACGLSNIDGGWHDTRSGLADHKPRLGSI